LDEDIENNILIINHSLNEIVTYIGNIYFSFVY